MSSRHAAAQKPTATKRESDPGRAHGAWARERGWGASLNWGQSRTRDVRLGDDGRPGSSGFSAFLQRKVEIGGADDPLEREADLVADRAMRMTDAPADRLAEPFTEATRRTVQRPCSSCRDDEKVLRKAEGAQSGAREAPPIVKSVLATAGSPLPADTAELMGSRLARDFTRVRVHRDAQAALSAEAVNARAYTVGQHIVFGAGRFAPDTADGQRLIAHELAPRGPADRGTTTPT